MSRVVHIVSHSHWDREWHRTFQQFRLQLVRLLDEVLATLATEPHFAHFMLDGQTIMLDDYLEIRPERAADLRRQIAAGRLLVGPWYVHPDEFLVGAEALVRNLLLGTAASESWGARMDAGYVPDQFGHIAQLPQIWRGFGIDTAVLWRGVDRATARTAFRWQGHDGSELLVAALPDGYNHGERLPLGGQALAERIRALAGSLEALAAPGQPLLLMNGGDHAGVQAGLPAALERAQEALDGDYQLVHSTLPAYLTALRSAGMPATRIEGELRDPRTAHLLPGVLSSRMWIKERNAAVQSLLERQAEPLAAMCAGLGEAYPAGELRQAWRYLLQNQPHDSICGCSIDQVHREMAIRFDWAEQIGVALRDWALATLATGVDSLLPGSEDPRSLAITVFNGAPVAQSGRIELRLHLAGEAASYELLDDAGAPVAHSWLGERGEGPTVMELPLSEAPDAATVMAQIEGDRVLGFGVLSVSMSTMGETLRVEGTIGDQALLTRAEIEQAILDALELAQSAGCTRVQATVHRSAELHLAALVPEVPARGYRTLLLRPRPAGAEGVEVPAVPMDEAGAEAIENERYRVTFEAESGGLAIVERASGLRIAPANLFVDGGDRGDLYTYCPPSLDTEVRAPEVSIEREAGPLGQSLCLRQVLPVPAGLVEPDRYERAAETRQMTIETTVRLAPGDPLVRIHTRVDNQARDHRLRVHFRLPFAADHAHAGSAFAVVERAAQPDRAGEWAEQPVATAPMQGFVAVHGEGGAVVLAARGLPEYELVPTPDGGAELALTLLRCVGWLSRGDLPVRRGEAGPSLPTPEAQCPGTFECDYAIGAGGEPWRALVPPARAFEVDLLSQAAACAEGTLPSAASLVRVTPPAVVQSALKGAEDGRGAILRIYNDDIVEHAARIETLLPLREALLTDLAERDGAPLFAGEPRSAFQVPVGPGRIVTVRLLWS